MRISGLRIPARVLHGMVLWAFCSCLGCCTVDFVHHGNQVTSDFSQSDRIWFTTGLVTYLHTPEPSVVAERCGSENFIAARHEQSWLQGLVSFYIPYGIYQPYSTLIQCTPSEAVTVTEDRI